MEVFVHLPAGIQSLISQNEAEVPYSIFWMPSQNFKMVTSGGHAKG